MKILKIFAVLLLFSAVMSCNNDDNGQIEYSGDNVVAFGDPAPSERTVFVFEGTEFNEIEIPFGFVRPLSDDTDVTISIDSENSEAVEGIDFSIVASTVTANAGETKGAFLVRFFENVATESGKKVVFNISADKVETAVFNNSYTINVSSSCVIESFVGQFTSQTWWYDPATFVGEIAVGSNPNTLEIVDFFPDNVDSPNFKLRYNPNTFVVSFQQQSTGAIAAAGEIFVKQADGKISRFNPCTRIMTLQVEYFVPGTSASSGDQVETFTGI